MVIGHLLNLIESEQFDQIEFVGKMQSLVSEVPFHLDRYLPLKLADFTDDVTTINPDDLLGGGGGFNAEEG